MWTTLDSLEKDSKRKSWSKLSKVKTKKRSLRSLRGWTRNVVVVGVATDYCWCGSSSILPVKPKTFRKSYKDLIKKTMEEVMADYKEVPFWSQVRSLKFLLLPLPFWSFYHQKNHENKSRHNFNKEVNRCEQVNQVSLIDSVIPLYLWLE